MAAFLGFLVFISLIIFAVSIIFLTITAIKKRNTGKLKLIPICAFATFSLSMFLSLKYYPQPMNNNKPSNDVEISKAKNKEVEEKKEKEEADIAPIDSKSVPIRDETVTPSPNPTETLQAETPDEQVQAEIALETDVVPAQLSDEEYKSQCQELWHDDIFFSEDNLEGKFVKLDLFVEEERFYDAEMVMYDSIVSDFLKEHDVKRTFYFCGVNRKEEISSYMGGQVNLYIPNEYDIQIAPGNHLIIYGKIVSYSTSSWDGYNSCYIVPRIIENND